MKKKVIKEGHSGRETEEYGWIKRVVIACVIYNTSQRSRVDGEGDRLKKREKI